MSKKLLYFNEALSEASKSLCDMRHGAVLVKGGQIISRGHNEPRPLDKIFATYGVKCCSSQHAECSAICNLLKSYKDSTFSRRSRKKCFLRFEGNRPLCS